MSKQNLPATSGSTLPAKRKTSNALDRIRSAKVQTSPALPPVQTDQALIDAALKPRRPRLVFGFDATASRAGAWDEAKEITDSLFRAVPGELDIALAVHGGSKLKIFTDFSSDVAAFRRQAAEVRCDAGNTCLVPLMSKTVSKSGVKVMSYIGDCYEEDENAAYEIAHSMKAKGIRAVMLFDEASGTPLARAVFERIADITGGACVDFRSGAGMQREMQEIFEAVAVLAAQGIKALEARCKELPGAIKLLPHLK